jgi:signal transduction histidine kinase/DNA-binding response OmpR family regulator
MLKTGSEATLVAQHHSVQLHRQLGALLVMSALLVGMFMVNEFVNAWASDGLGNVRVLHLIGLGGMAVLGGGWWVYYRSMQRWQQEVLRLRMMAENASQAKTDFLANMSHEIRTPLNGVIGMLGLLAQMQLSERQREYVDTIRKSSEQLLLVINDVLDVAKIEAGQLSLEPIPFDIATHTNDVVETFVAEATRKGLEMIVRYAPAMPTRVVGDPGRYRQIVTNLIGNALKFTARGYVMVDVEMVGQESGRGVFRVRVVDTGVGIPADKVKTVFERFAQVDASTTRKYGGSGLGLAITRELVRMMGGEIKVESIEGRGCTFSFTLDLLLDKVAGSRVPLPSAEILRGLCVLAVDDGEVNRQILREILESVGAVVSEADSGAATLARLARGEVFDMILVDNRMPDYDGLALGRAIKKHSQAMLVVHTSIGQRGDALRFEEEGFAAYVLKPFTPTELIEVLCLARNRMLAPGAAKDGFVKGIITRHMLHDVKDNGDGQRAGLKADYGEVLVVEDDKVNQNVLGAILEKLGAHATVAENGQQAVEMVRAHPFGLILMDMNMPVMNGPDAARAIRDMELASGRQAMPIIALTANAMKEHREECLAAGMHDYLTKPVTVEKLQQVLEKWVVPGSVTATTEEREEESDGLEGAAVDIGFVNSLTDSDAEVQRRLFGVFFEHAQAYIATLEEAPLGAEAWKQAAHKLRGSAASLGVFGLSNACARAEEADLGEDKEDLLDGINGCFAEVRRFCEGRKLV